VLADITIPSHYGVSIPLIFILVAEYPAAVSLKASDAKDELEGSGFMDRLCAADRKKAPIRGNEIA